MRHMVWRNLGTPGILVAPAPRTRDVARSGDPGRDRANAWRRALSRPCRSPRRRPHVFRACSPHSERECSGSRERADGAHPYLTVPAATGRAREFFGPGKLLLPERAFLLERDATKARRIGRAYLSWYLGIENFRRSLLRQGLTEDDLAGGGSDRLVDALVAWGDEEVVRKARPRASRCGRRPRLRPGDLRGRTGARPGRIPATCSGAPRAVNVMKRALGRS